MTKRKAGTATDLPTVTVVTHPLGGAGENATRTLLDILAAITKVSLITADLPEDSTIRSEHQVTEISTQGAAQSTIITAGLRFLRNQLRMCRAIYRTESDVILFFGATAYLLPIVWAKLLGRTVVLEPRGDVPLTLQLQWEQTYPSPIARGGAWLVRTIETAGYRIADGIITYTPSMATELGLDRYQEKLHPHGARYVDTDQFTRQTPIEEREQTVGFLGRLDEEKGIRTVVQVAKQLPDEITFIFAGDGPLRGWIEEELANEIAAGSVELTGWVDHDEVPAVLNQLQLLVLPSQPTEGLPTVILESFACGTPVYATPVSGVPDVVVDGETGFVINDRTADTMTEDITRIIEEEELSKLSQQSRELVEREYSFEGATERYRSILTKIE